jgi:hypothetical protein
VSDKRPSKIARHYDAQYVWNPDDADKFDDRIRRTENHWLWTGYVDASDGYGRFKPRHNERAQLAHRVAYVRWVGIIPDDKPVIDHLGHPFNLRRCVRPECLEAISHEENIRRGDSPAGKNARKTHCPGCGSEYNETNTVYRPNGERRCRICRERAKTAVRRANGVPVRAGRAS